MRSSHRHGIWKREEGEMDPEPVEGIDSGTGPLSSHVKTMEGPVGGRGINVSLSGALYTKGGHLVFQDRE